MITAVAVVCIPAMEAEETARRVMCGTADDARSAVKQCPSSARPVFIGKDIYVIILTPIKLL